MIGCSKSIFVLYTISLVTSQYLCGLALILVELNILLVGHLMHYFPMFELLAEPLSAAFYLSFVTTIW